MRQKVGLKKVCRNCAQLKEESEFHKKGFGRDSRCKVCIARLKKEWFKKRQENIKNRIGKYTNLNFKQANAPDWDMFNAQLVELISLESISYGNDK
jgi:hypothetical protein